MKCLYNVWSDRCKTDNVNIKVVFYWDQPFQVGWLVELFRVLLTKNRFRLVWLLNFFNPHQTGLKRLKKHW